MLILIIKLVLAHLVGDFLFQPKKWVDSKEKKKHKSKYLYAHIAVHLLALLALFQLSFQYIVAYAIIILSHFIIDLLKLILNDKFKEQKRLLFFVDQMLHFTMILIVVKYYYPNFNFLNTIFETKNLVLVAFMIFVSFTSNIIMTVILSKWNVNEINTTNEESLQHAGKYIGILERLFIFFLVIFNYPLGIGLLITAKSVFRYNDLSQAKDRKLTEYVLIGSMLSFGLAIIAGLAYKNIISAI